MQRIFHGPGAIGELRSTRRLARLLCALAIAGAGCGPADSDSTGVTIALTLDPSPTVVGSTGVSLVMTDANGAPFERAQVRVEGNMNHAGMVPTFADLKEVEPGRYHGTLAFTMGGDWFLLVTATAPDGTTVQRKIDVPGVQAK